MLRKIKTFAWNKFLRSNVGHKLTALLGYDIKPQKWLFIVGCYNSGTTLLREILSDHHEIGVLPAEGVRLTDILPFPEKFGWTRMWSKCQSKMQLDLNYFSRKEQAKRIRSQWSIAYNKTAPVLLEKSIANATQLEFFEQEFQPAYFIYIIRNGYAVAEGIRRRAHPAKWNNPYFKDKYPIDLCAYQWRMSHELVEQQTPNLKNFLPISYEELTDDPVITLNKITDCVGIKPIEPQKNTKERCIGHLNSKIKNQNATSIKRLSKNEIIIIQKIAGDLLAKMGYFVS